MIIKTVPKTGIRAENPGKGVVESKAMIEKRIINMPVKDNI
jgi:hypothetical protein